MDETYFRGLRFVRGAPYWFPETQLDYMVGRLGATKYLGAFAAQAKTGGWTEDPADMFYSARPDTTKGHKHFVGIIKIYGVLVVFDATRSLVDVEMEAAVAADGELVISRYRHDYRTSEDGTTFADGGRDYMRSNMASRGTALVAFDARGELIVTGRRFFDVNAITGAGSSAGRAADS